MINGLFYIGGDYLKIGIIDADLIDGGTTFPNLVCMKLSSYYKHLGHNTKLLLDYDDVDLFDKVFISKVFDYTFTPEKVLSKSNVEYGGTGFFFDEAPPLPDDIEHMMPDYHLYDQYVSQQLESGVKRDKLKFYIDYSIGYTTRRCFRGCEFCVNQNYTEVIPASPVEEFLDNSRKYILLLDDNILGLFNGWKDIFHSLQATGKPFQYKQGMDERLLTEESITEIFKNSKWHGDYIFAFDDYKDRKVIERKLQLIRTLCPNISNNIKFYVFCGFKRKKRTYTDFFLEDIIETFERIRILDRYNCLPYIMRHKDYCLSPYAGLYKAIAAWCNQPSLFRKFKFRDFCIQRGMDYKIYKQYKNDYDQYLKDGYKKGSTWRYMEEFEKEHPDIAAKYFDM
jgi:hypothetical protein